MLFFLSSVFLSVGLYFIVSEAFHLPSFASSMAISNLTKKQSQNPGKLDVLVSELSVKLAGHIHMNEYRREQLEADLISAGIETSPELFTAHALMKAAVILVLAIPLGIVSPMLIPIVMFFSVYIYIDASQSVRNRIHKRRKVIEHELPRLVATVEKTLKHNRDVLNILDTYKANAGAELKHELDITVADMRTGNLETALRRLDNRVGSTMMSDVTRGLIGILHGDDTLVYWQELGIKFADWQRQLLKQQANKVPGKVKKLIMALLFCFTATYFVVLGMEIVQNLGGML